MHLLFRFTTRDFASPLTHIGVVSVACKRNHEVCIGMSGAAYGLLLTVIVEVFAQGCGSFPRAGTSKAGRVPILKIRFRKGLGKISPVACFYDAINLPVVEISARETLPHPCARPR